MDGRDYLLAPTDAGRQQANDRMQLSRYVGPVPVSLAAYADVDPRAARQPAHRPRGPEGGLLRPGRERAPAARARPGRHRRRRHVPLRPARHRQVVDRRAAAAHLRRPRARALRGRGRQPDHQRVRPGRAQARADEQPLGIDRRWVLCHRPCLIVGGELGPEMLDLQYQRDSGTYVAPLQMQANNGILVIDDFGRQADLTPEALLNRWIVPARPPARPPDARPRREVRHPVRRQDRVLHQPPARDAGRRGVLPPHPVEGAHPVDHRRRLRRGPAPGLRRTTA